MVAPESRCYRVDFQLSFQSPIEVGLAALLQEQALQYDYIIVGAGSAGCVMGNRLSADRSCAVLLLEEGGNNDSVFVDMPAALSIPMNRKRFNWGFASTQETHMNGRSLDCPRGRGLGGSSAINGMVYVRGHRKDFDRWAEMGAEGWSGEEVLPFFERSEAVLRPQHGTMQSVLYRRYLQAGAQAGHAVSDDLNTGDQEGVGPLAMTVLGGRRHSVKRAYLEPSLHRHNLTVQRRSYVDRVVFEGRRASEVVWRNRFGQERRATARQAVVLCAGAIGSPAILERSGIGQAERLSALGVPVVHDVPGVGENLMDHLEVYVQYACTQPVSLHSWLNPLGKLWIGMQWFFAQRGLGATNHFETGAFVRSDEQAGWPDVQFHFLPAAMRYDGTKVNAGHGFQIHAGPMLPESRGSVHIESRVPQDAPRIHFNYLANARDREVFRLAVRHARTLIHQPAFDDLRGAELAPGSLVQGDDELDAWVRANAESAYHPCGTCRMGRDDASVVDAQGRVHGVANLRVVDASIFPFIPNGNLNAPTIMCAEKIAAGMVAGR